MKSLKEQLLKPLYHVYTFVLSKLLVNRRKQKAAELRRHIAMLLANDGCVLAEWHLTECRHIIEHYRIPPSEVGFCGDFQDLEFEFKSGYWLDT